jgi:hypothetical protein
MLHRVVYDAFSDQVLFNEASVDAMDPLGRGLQRFLADGFEWCDAAFGVKVARVVEAAEAKGESCQIAV